MMCTCDKFNFIGIDEKCVQLIQWKKKTKRE